MDLKNCLGLPYINFLDIEYNKYYYKCNNIYQCKINNHDVFL